MNRNQLEIGTGLFTLFASAIEMPAVFLLFSKKEQGCQVKGLNFPNIFIKYMEIVTTLHYLKDVS